MKKFIQKMVIITILIGLVNYLLSTLFNMDLSDNYYSICYFFLINLLVFYIFNLGINQSNSLFIKTFYLGIFVQLLFSLLGIVTYLILISKKSIPFIVSYLVFYIFYTVFEIIILLSTLRAVSKTGRKD